MLRQQKAQKATKKTTTRGIATARKTAVKKTPVKAKSIIKSSKVSFSSAPTGDEYDLVVIGGGPAGYVGAIKAAQLGLKVACVENRGSLGGTCLNVGCIPSKALLNATHHYYDAKNHFKALGIEGGDGVSMNHNAMMKTKEGVVSGLTKGIEGLFKKNKVTYIVGKGKITGNNDVTVALNVGGSQALKAKNILIATGSEPSVIPGVNVDEERIVTSTGALSLKETPKRMIVIGAGVIGLELGSVFSRIGSEVTVMGNVNRIAVGVDSEVATAMQKTLTKQGLKFKLGVGVQSVVRKGEEVEVTVNKDGVTEVVTADVVLLSTGRKPYVQGLGLEEMGINFGRSIDINEHYQTNIPNIYAVGDVAGNKPMLAHLAEEEAIFVVSQLAGKHGHIDYNAIPGVIYTHPEVATVGKSEDDLKAEGIAYKVGKFPFLANSRAVANLDKDGLVKIMACSKTDKILGVHMMGPTAGELIAEMTLAINFGASSEDLALLCHAHPSFSEAVCEATKMAATGKAIQF